MAPKGFSRKPVAIPLVRAAWMVVSSVSLAGGLLLLAGSLAVRAEAQTTLDAIRIAALPGNRVRLEIVFSAPASKPLTFAIHNPARIALDFPGVRLNLAHKTQAIAVGTARSVTAVEAGGRARVVANLGRLVPYKVRLAGRSVIVTLEGPRTTGSAGARALAAAALGSISNIDFQPGPAGESRVMVTFSDPNAVADARREGRQILVEFANTRIPKRLERRLDVLDFGTPVKTVDTFSDNDGVRMVIMTTGLFEHVAYQSDNLFVIGFKPVGED
jgi:type IV pilus assembly protein PilQ